MINLVKDKPQVTTESTRRKRGKTKSNYPSVRGVLSVNMQEYNMKAALFANKSYCSQIDYETVVNLGVGEIVIMLSYRRNNMRYFFLKKEAQTDSVITWHHISPVMRSYTVYKTSKTINRDITPSFYLIENREAAITEFNLLI